MQTFNRAAWRGILAVLPLPTLALAASYGVWSFNSMYLPFWFAVISAASFELVYLGLAVAQLERPQRRKATAISVGAVVVSVVYNTLSGLAHRQPEWFTNLPWYYEWGLALIHGAPLAIVAYLVSDLLIHQDVTRPDTTRLGLDAVSYARVPAQMEYPEPIQVDDVPDVIALSNETLPRKPETFNLARLDAALVTGETISPAALCQRIGASRSTVNRLIAEALKAGTLAREGRGTYRVV